MLLIRQYNCHLSLVLRTAIEDMPMLLSTCLSLMFAGIAMVGFGLSVLARRKLLLERIRLNSERDRVSHQIRQIEQDIKDLGLEKEKAIGTWIRERAQLDDAIRQSMSIRSQFERSINSIQSQILVTAKAIEFSYRDVSPMNFRFSGMCSSYVAASRLF